MANIFTPDTPEDKELQQLLLLERQKQEQSFGKNWQEAEHRQIKAEAFADKAWKEMHKHLWEFDDRNKHLIRPVIQDENDELLTETTSDMSKRGNKNVKDVSFTRVADYPINKYGHLGLCEVPSVLTPKFVVINNLIEAISDTNKLIQHNAEIQSETPKYLTMRISSYLMDDKQAELKDGEESANRKAVSEAITLDITYGKLGSIASITIVVDFVKRNFHERMEEFEKVILKFGIQSMMQLAAIQLIDNL